MTLECACETDDAVDVVALIVVGALGLTCGGPTEAGRERRGIVPAGCGSKSSDVDRIVSGCWPEDPISCGAMGGKAFSVGVSKATEESEVTREREPASGSTGWSGLGIVEDEADLECTGGRKGDDGRGDFELRIGT